MGRRGLDRKTRDPFDDEANSLLGRPRRKGWELPALFHLADVRITRSGDPLWSHNTTAPRRACPSGASASSTRAWARRF